MAKSSRGSSTSPRPNTPPPVFAPMVAPVPTGDFTVTNFQFDQLERAGGVKLSKRQRTNLVTLAIFWIDDLRLRRTARPRAFRECFDKMEGAFLQAEEVCRCDRAVERHLVHWAMETRVNGADGFPVTLAGLEQHLKNVREMVVALRNCLPQDPGRRRPFDDERRIINLANIFEDAGGKAVAYAGGYYEEGNMTDTPFRRFAQRFYALLPAGDKRAPGGLDDALRDALAVRRAGRTRPRN